MDITQILNITLPQAIAIWAAIFLFSIVANAMPEPTQDSGKAYRWVYGIMHWIGTNLGSVLAAIKPKFPKPPMDPPRG